MKVLYNALSLEELKEEYNREARLINRKFDWEYESSQPNGHEVCFHYVEAPERLKAICKVLKNKWNITDINGKKVGL